MVLKLGVEPRVLSRSILLVVPVILTLDMATLIYAAFKGAFPATVSLGSPLAYRNIYIHVPIALSSYLLFAVAALGAMLYLWKEDPRGAKLSYTAVVLGVVYAALTLITGSTWAQESWGVAWNWDPKQTAVLFLFLAFLAYFPIRRSISDPERRERVSAAYAAAAFSLVIVSFLANRIVESLHPTGQAIQQFSAEPVTGVLFGLRMLFALGTAISLLAVGYLGLTPPRILGASVAVVGIIAALALASPIVGGEIYRVVDAKLDSSGNIIELVVSDGSGEREVVFDNPIPSPIVPAITIDGRITIVGHLIKLKDEGFEVVPHWSTPLGVALYTLSISALLLRRWNKDDLNSSNANTIS